MTLGAFGNPTLSRNVTNRRLKIDSDFAKLHSEISNKITKSYSIVAFSTSEILEVNRINPLHYFNAK